MKVKLFITITACVLLGGACKDELHAIYPTYVEEKTEGYEGYELVWAEEFDYEGLPDPACWVAGDWGGVINDEPQDYRKNDLKYTHVENGNLILETHKDPHEGTKGWGSDEPYHFEYSSGEVHTKGKYEFQYGRIDIAAKIPVGKGAWPAFWLMPAHNTTGKYAEIDIMEFMYSVGNDNQTISGTFHTEASRNGGEETVSGWGKSATLEDKYHLYSLIWEEEKIEILFDNKTVVTYEKPPETSDLDHWPWDQPFFLIMNIAVGPTWGDNELDESLLPLRMEVDYVRYYKLIKTDEPDDPDEPDPDEPVNLFENGDFEGSFNNGDPAVNVDGINPVNATGQVLKEKYLNRWMSNGGTLAVDFNGGTDGSSGCLKQTFAGISNPWENNVIYAPGKIPAGKYKFCYYVKANKETALQNIISIFENSEDLGKGNHQTKVLLYNDGKWIVDPSFGYMPKGLTPGHTITTSWQKVEYIIDIPQNELVTFSLRPCYSTDYGKHSNCTDMEFYYDQFSLTLDDGSGDGGDEEPEYGENLFDNGSFEGQFGNGEPVINPGTDQPDPSAANYSGYVLKEQYQNRFLANNKDGELIVEQGDGADGTEYYLKETFKSISNPWENNVIYTPGQLSAGKYLFSFYVKANKETSLQNIISIFENDDDMAKGNHQTKVLQCKDGKWTVDPSHGYMPKGLEPGHTVTTEWQKIEYEIEIPSNLLITFSLRPCYSGDWTKHSNCTDMEFCYDEFSLVEVL